MLAMLIVVAHLAGQPAAEDVEPPALRTTTAPKAPDRIRKDDLVCRKEALVGTRMPVRICLTQGEWAERGIEDRDKVEKAQSQKPALF